jgi:hypothetical protein
MKAITDGLIDSAAKNDWILVTGNTSILANTFADTILIDLSKSCDD